MTAPTPLLIEAVRVGCNAATGDKCVWPACLCDELPRAIQAAVAFAVRDVAKELPGFAREVAREVVVDKRTGRSRRRGVSN